MSTKTAEAVCVGHPDKLCDLIADTILDDILYEDPAAHVAVEVMASGHRIIVTGEITTVKRPRIRQSVRYALVKAGYVPWKFLVFVWTRRQSPDINAGVSKSLEARFGDDTEFALKELAIKALSTVTPRMRRESVCHCRSCSHMRSVPASIRLARTARSPASSPTAKRR